VLARWDRSPDLDGCFDAVEALDACFDAVEALDACYEEASDGIFSEHPLDRSE
jgi:hypothetical protein